MLTCRKLHRAKPPCFSKTPEAYQIKVAVVSMLIHIWICYWIVIPCEMSCVSPKMTAHATTTVVVDRMSCRKLQHTSS